MLMAFTCTIPPIFSSCYIPHGGRSLPPRSLFQTHCKNRIPTKVSFFVPYPLPAPSLHRPPRSHIYHNINHHRNIPTNYYVNGQTTTPQLDADFAQSPVLRQNPTHVGLQRAYDHVTSPYNYSHVDVPSCAPLMAEMQQNQQLCA